MYRVASGNVVVRTEPTLIAGAGGAGKTFACLDLGLTASLASVHGAENGVRAMCGLVAKPARWGFAVWEDDLGSAARRIDAMVCARARQKPDGWDGDGKVMIAEDAGEGGVLEVELPRDREAAHSLASLEEAAREVRVVSVDAPLFAPPPTSASAPARPTPAMRDLFANARAAGIEVLVIDPVAAAYAGKPNEATGVRAFITALREMAGEDMAVVMVAHSTKAYRRGEEETGAASGSAQWTDGSRSVLTFAPPPKIDRIDPKPSPTAIAKAKAEGEDVVGEWRARAAAAREAEGVAPVAVARGGQREGESRRHGLACAVGRRARRWALRGLRQHRGRGGRGGVVSRRADRVREAIARDAARAFGLPPFARRWTRIPCSLHGGSGRNLAIRDDGLWTCHSAQCHGTGNGADAIAFHAYAEGITPIGAPLTGDAFRRALASLEAAYGMPSPRDGMPPPRARIAAPMRAPSVRSAPSPPKGRTANPAVADLWARCVPLDAAEAEAAWAYLTRTRGVLPSDGPRPRMVRALMRDDLPRDLRGSAPADLDLAIAYGCCAPAGGPVGAIQLDGLRADGSLCEERWRRSRGPTEGHVLRIRGRGGEDGHLAIAEGPLDALRLSLREDVGEARAVLGTAGLTPAKTRAWGGEVVIYADGDAKGIAAARNLMARLAIEEGGARPVRIAVWEGTDPARARANRATSSPTPSSPCAPSPMPAPARPLCFPVPRTGWIPHIRPLPRQNRRMRANRGRFRRPRPCRGRGPRPARASGGCGRPATSSPSAGAGTPCWASAAASRRWMRRAPRPLPRPKRGREGVCALCGLEMDAETAGLGWHYAKSPPTGAKGVVVRQCHGRARQPRRIAA